MSGLRAIFKHAVNLAFVAALAVALASCSSTRHVPDGQFLLDDVKINIEDNDNIHNSDLVNYLRQTSNHKVLGGLKLQLAFYNISGRDSTKWFNKWLQRVGSAPVIYDSALTVASAEQLQRAMSNKGYMKAEVDYDVNKNAKKKKARVTYNLRLHEPYRVTSVDYDISDSTLRHIILADSASFPIKEQSLFDHNQLDEERQLITENLRRKGYFAFNKEYINFIADTTQGSKDVALTLVTRAPYRNEHMPNYTEHRPFSVRNVIFVTDYDPVSMYEGNYSGADTTSIDGYTIYYGDNHYLRRKVLLENCYITPGKTYNSDDVTRTYQAFGRLGIVKFINIDVKPVGEIDGTEWLDAYILLNRDKTQTVSVSLEGTNSEGDLGFGVGLDYQHRNIFRGSETLNAKFKMSYESLSGNLRGLINDNYSEYSGEVGITYPKFKFPLLPMDFKKKIQASTELSVNFNYQERPEYTRIIAGAGWKYIWSEQQGRTKHTFNFIDLNYVYLPKSRPNFLDSISNPLLRYSYEDHLIMRMGYSFYRTNKVTNSSPLAVNTLDNIFTVRATGEIAGNVLYGISNLVNQKHDENDSYKVFGIRYAQYVKLDADYSFTHYFNSHGSIAMHVGGGVAVPYGNSSVIPFEKRFYSGGANSVRGWGVRSLGPGSFDGRNSQNSFIYQCGDVRFDANIEYREKLFWVIEMAAFIDAGNIWTIRDYDDQPGGVFKFNKFYKQIAAAYGLGLRLDFTYFLLRFDLGMKAHNPASNQKHWPLTSPRFSRDAEFHFSVGYPF